MRKCNIFRRLLYPNPLVTLTLVFTGPVDLHFHISDPVSINGVIWDGPGVGTISESHSGTHTYVITHPEHLTELVAENAYLISITGLESCVNLQVLNFNATSAGYGYQGSSFTIPDIVSLTTIYFSGPNITSFVVPATLTALTDLYIVYMPNLTSFTTHSEWINLVTFNLKHTSLTTLTIYFWSLYNLDISYNELTTLNLPSGLVAFGIFYASHNHLSTIDITKIRYFALVDLSFNELTTFIDTANEQHAWNHLFLNDNQLVTVTFLVGDFQNFSKLRLQNNLISSFSMAQAAQNLREFNLSNNQLASFTVTHYWMSIPIGYRDFNISGNALNVTDINRIYTEFDSIGSPYQWSTGDKINTSGGTNSAPSGLGIVSKNNMVGRGVSVTSN